MARYLSCDLRSYLAIRLRLLPRLTKLHTTSYTSLFKPLLSVLPFHTSAFLQSVNSAGAPVDYLEHASALPSRGLFSELRAVELEASRNGGRNALGVLERLEDRPQGDHEERPDIISKSIKCLQAYHDRIEPLSIEDAKIVLAADNAGTRVLRWAFSPEMKAKIEGNHPEKMFVSCVA